MKYIRLTLMGMLTAAAIISGYSLYNSQSAKANISDFEDCAAAGYPVQESYPERCVTPDGQSFKQET